MDQFVNAIQRGAGRVGQMAQNDFAPKAQAQTGAQTPPPGLPPSQNTLPTLHYVGYTTPSGVKYMVAQAPKLTSPWKSTGGTYFQILNPLSTGISENDAVNEVQNHYNSIGGILAPQVRNSNPFGGNTYGYAGGGTCTTFNSQLQSQWDKQYPPFNGNTF